MNPENNLGNDNQLNPMNSSTLGVVPNNNSASPAPVSNDMSMANNLSSIGLENLSNNIANNQDSSVTLGSAINDFVPSQPAPTPDVNPAAPAAPTEGSVAPTPEVSTPAPVSEAPAVANPEPITAPETQQPQGLGDILGQTQNININPVDTVNTDPVQNNMSNSSINDVMPTPEVAPTGTVDNGLSASMQSGPTMPIPDTMPDVGYQAGVSTPVDYATPMSNFDEIGVTPELDPKAKQKGNNKKTIMFVLILLAIAALGAGSYYLINVKKIFDKSSVVLKELTLEQGANLSENINDYATFKNTSSSNCVSDVTNVDVTTPGTYTYTIKCGDKEYSGKIHIQDTTPPQVVLKANIVKLDEIANVTADSFIASCNETACTYKLDDSQDLSSLVTEKGLYPVKINVSDSTGNTANYYVPLIVIDTEVHLGVSATKEIANTDEYNVTERVVVLYTDASYVTYTLYDIRFNSEDMLSTYIPQINNTETMDIFDYSGIPILTKEENKITLISKNANNLIQGSYGSDIGALNSTGYSAKPFGSDYIEELCNI